MKTIINLSDITLTPEFRSRGVYDLPTNDKYRLKELIDMSSSLVSPDEILARADQMTQLAKTTGAKKAMIYANNFMLFAIENCLRLNGIIPVHPRGVVKSFSEYSEAHQKIITKRKFYLTDLIETPSHEEIVEYVKAGSL